MITSTSHLPPISFCEFDGDENKWEQFISSFPIMIDGLPITKVQKFNYLTEQAKLINEQSA